MSGPDLFAAFLYSMKGELCMKTKGTVVKVDGTVALVECSRISACDACHKNENADGTASCHVCSLMGGAGVMRVPARNPQGAMVGDQVLVENTDSRVLKDAALVFLFPIIGMLLGYFIASAMSLSETVCYLVAAALLLLSVITVGIYSAWRGKRQTPLVVTEILHPLAVGGDDKQAGENC